MIEGVVYICINVDAVRFVHVVPDIPNVIEPCRITMSAYYRLIDESVVSISADDPHWDAAAHIAGDDCIVIAAVQVETNLARFRRVKTAIEPWRIIPALYLNIHDSIA